MFIKSRRNRLVNPWITNGLINNSSIVLDFSIYADGTCLIVGVDKKEYNRTIKFELHKVLEWLHCNQLLINVDKTGY